MHSFIILGDDIYTLDTAEERKFAAEHMRDAMMGRCRVFRGTPESYAPDGRAFFSDGTIAYYVEWDADRRAFEAASHKMTGCYGGHCGLVS